MGRFFQFPVFATLLLILSWTSAAVLRRVG